MKIPTDTNVLIPLEPASKTDLEPTTSVAVSCGEPHSRSARRSTSIRCSGRTLIRATTLIDEYYDKSSSRSINDDESVIGIEGGHCRGDWKASRRHCAAGFPRFMNAVDKALPEEQGVKLHIVMDNVSTHKTKQVRPAVPRSRPLHTHRLKLAEPGGTLLR